MSIKFGVFVPQGWRMDLVEIADPVAQFEAMTSVAREADKGAWDSIWVFDHFHTVPTPTIETTFECWTITATLARDTNRVKIGQMVGCNGYRNPALYAKIASTVDVASHGRLYAGIGAGWYEHEWKAYGYQWDDIPVRMAKFREAVEIIHRMWTEEKPVFMGKHYQIDGPINEPKGVQKPRIPLWIGGGGEKVTLKLVAKYGNACNIGGDAATIRHKLGVLKQHCDDVGRDYNEITKSAEAYVHLIPPGADPDQATRRGRGAFSYEDWSKRNIVGTPAEVAERLAPLVDAGIQYFIVYLTNVAYDLDLLHQFEEGVIPKFA
jgi:F420-dependent oxidoreductase-like protein